jgi:hypothetical protein
MRRFWLIVLTLTLMSSFAHAQQATPPPDMPVPADQLAKEKINPPVVIKRVIPEYPDFVRSRHINARCSASLTVDVNGIPQNIKLVRCTEPVFAQFFLDAVSKIRYKPATTQQGKPVAVETNMMIDTKFSDGRVDLGNLIHCGFSSPPGVISTEPGADGVYPLTKITTPPTLTKFSDEDYGDTAFMLDGNSACDILLTITAAGKATDPKLIYCESAGISKPAIQSLLKSSYKPGKINGKAVPIRVSVHLEYSGVNPNY